jgi:hypothetical protein
MSTTCIKRSDLETSIYVENKLEKSIYVIPGFNYPDVNISINRDVLQANGRYQFEPLSQDYMRLYGICIEKYWKEFIPSDTLLIFVLDKDSVDNKDWGNYVNGNNFLRRYKLSYEDIIQNGCKIIVE